MGRGGGAGELEREGVMEGNWGGVRWSREAGVSALGCGGLEKLGLCSWSVILILNGGLGKEMCSAARASNCRVFDRQGLSRSVSKQRANISWDRG